MASVWIDRRDWDDSDLPDVCISCGEPTNERLTRTFSWMPGWVYVLILCHLLVFLIVALIMRQSWRASVPVCPLHRGHWWKRTGLILGTLVGAIALGIVVGVLAESMTQHAPGREGEGFVFGWLAGVGGLFCWLILAVIVSSYTIRATEMTKRGIRLGRVSPAFADAYKEMTDRRVKIDERVLERWQDRGVSRRPEQDDPRVRPEEDDRRGGATDRYRGE